MPDVGYSTTPLFRKLGLKDGQVVAFVELPDTLARLAEGAEFSEARHEIGWGGFTPPARFDVIHGFTRRRAELEIGIPGMLAAIKPAGMIWVSWPKKSAKVATDITENDIREVALPLGLVDVKVCAVDEIWSGLKLVIRKDRR